jgi:hypothetical protein
MRLLRLIIGIRLWQGGTAALGAARERHALYDPLARGLLRLVTITLVVACATSMCGPAAFASTQQGQKDRNANLRQLWSAFPLDRHQGATPRQGVGSESAHAQPTLRAEDQSTGGSNLRLLVTVVVAMLLAGGVVVFAFHYPRAAPLISGRGSRAKPAVRLTFRPSEGGSVMANPRRKLWGRNDADVSPEQVSSGGGDSKRVAERISAYSASKVRSAAAESGREPVAEPVTDEEAVPPEAEVPADLSVFGDEIGTVLKSAQEAADRIRRTANEEAARRRDEIEAATAAEVAEARRIAEADRADAHRIRAEAEAQAKDTRAAADAFAEQRRAEAEREAASIEAHARTRLEAADVEVEQKVREAEAKARERVNLLQAEAERYEGRLENLLIIFREMSSKLEVLLGTPRNRSEDGAAASDKAFEQALRPDASNSRAG